MDRGDWWRELAPNVRFSAQKETLPFESVGPEMLSPGGFQMFFCSIETIDRMVKLLQGGF